MYNPTDDSIKGRNEGKTNGLRNVWIPWKTSQYDYVISYYEVIINTAIVRRKKQTLQF